MEEQFNYYLELLRERNEKLSQQFIFIKNYEKIYSELKKLKNEIVIFTQKTKELELTGGEKVSPDIIKKLQEFEDKLYKKQEELTESLRVNAQRATEILNQSREIQKQESVIKNLQGELEMYQNENHSLKQKNASNEKIIEEKIKTIQILVNEKDATNQQLVDSLKERKALKNENDALLDQMLQMKQKQIDKMNEINELYQTVAKQKKELERIKEKYKSGARKGNNEKGGELGESSEVFELKAPKKMEKRINVNCEINSLELSQNGVFVAAACIDNSAKVFHSKTGQLLGIFQGCRESVVRVKISPDDEFLLATSADASVRLWSVSNQRLKHVLTGHSKRVNGAAFSSKEMNRIVTGGNDRTIKIWDLQRGTSLKTIAITCASSVYDLDISTSNIICSAHFDKGVRMHDLRSYKLSFHIKNAHGGPVTSVSFNNDERYILTTGKDNKVHVYDIRTLKLVNLLSNGSYFNKYNHTKACFSPCSKYVAVGSGNGRVIVWDRNSGKTEVVLKGHRNTVTGVQWLNTGEKLYSCSFDKTIRVWS